MVLPRNRRLKAAYINDPYKNEWIPDSVSPIISKLIETEAMIEKRIAETSGDENSDKLSKIIKESGKKKVDVQSKRISQDFIFSLDKKFDLEASSSLDYSPDLPYNSLLDNLKDLCRKLSILSIEKCQDKRNQLILDFSKNLKQCQDISKSINVLDARKMTFLSPINPKEHELHTESLNRVLVTLFQGLLEDERKEWEQTIGTEARKVHNAAQKEQSESLRQFYETSLLKLQQNKDQIISLPKYYTDAFKEADVRMLESCITEEDWLPLNHFDNNISEKSPDYKNLIKREVVNMYLLHLKSGLAGAE